jgi:gamma-glutamyl:cysteine ligase YbdK (ATP-grasp superfamily)
MMNTIDETKSIAELREALIKKEARERELDNNEKMLSSAAGSSNSTTATASTLNATATSALVSK